MSNLVWCVSAVLPRDDYTLLLTFENGEKRVHNARTMLEKPLCAPLKKLQFFMRTRAAISAVVWDDELDIAPERLYETSVPMP